MDKVSTKKLNSEQWKYTNSDIFKNFDLNFKPTSKVLKQKCNLNEIIIYNGQVIQCGENIANDKIQIHFRWQVLERIFSPKLVSRMNMMLLLKVCYTKVLLTKVLLNKSTF